ncbi:lytic polysaccharide monooxygenase [Kitasatospora sp. NPDC051853]|uniref:lytic polysaccharide monooxygenase auxiliary activity family 9 protein n=1 Tax=Kitasatospora sp. NPDC051853 TaxID=3364058 RepID=UPI0037B71B83
MPVLRRLAPALLLASALTATAGPAQAHGSLQKPLSRIEGCYLEGAEHPKSAACQAAVALGGTPALYDWMSLRIGEAAGRHRQLIPDGKLCSAGDPTYRGLDLPRADWPATRLTSGAAYTFEFRATAPHKGTFELYLTNASYSPTKPLTWANLDPKPFLTATDPQLSNGSYLLPGRVPAGRTGRQLVYVIWQRSDSPEAFYSCSDVVFDGAGTAATAPTAAVPGTTDAGHDHGTGAPSPSRTPARTPSPSRAPSSTATPTPPTAPAASSAPPAPAVPPTAPPTATVSENGPQLARTAADAPGAPVGLVVALVSAPLLLGAAVLLRRRLRPGRGNHR